MRVLLDICALTELRHSRGNEAVKAAVALIPDDDLYLSVLTVGEIAGAIALLPNARKKRGLNEWLIKLKTQFADRILTVDFETAQFWGEIRARVQQSGEILPAINGLVAATALRHGLHLMTRYSTKFTATGVLIVDPWNDDESATQAG
jgi:predicted nucleic acid-binding protein